MTHTSLQELNHDHGAVMKLNDIKSLPLEKLWDLREKIMRALATKLTAEKSVLEVRLQKLNSQSQMYQVGKARKSYPSVLPKYRNPNEPSETWAGRGRQPRWLVAALKSGKQIDDFRI